MTTFSHLSNCKMDTAAVTPGKRNFKMDTLLKKVSKWNLGPHTFFLALSMGFFLCVISSLILVTTLSNYAVTYETRDLLEKLVIGENYFSAGPEITTSEIISSSGVTDNGDNASTSHTTSEFFSTITTKDEVSKETESATTSGESFTSTTEISDTGNGTTTYQPKPILKNPVSILNELMQQTGTNYSCTKTCLHPTIFQVQLQLRLSVAKDNFLRLTHSVQTADVRVAKKYMAYLALDYLYKEYVNQSEVEEEWLKEIDICGEKVDELIPNCKKQNQN